MLVGIAGLAIFPLARRRGTDLTRMVLDGIVLGGSVLFVASVTLFPQILQTSDGAARRACSCRSPMWSSRPMATLLFLRGAPPDRPVLGLAAAGFVCYAVSDFAYAVLVSQTGTYTFGSIIDLGWIAGYALIALAVRSPGSEASPHGERPWSRPRCWAPSVMFTLFLVAAVLSLVKLNRGTLTAPSAVLWLVVLLAVLARQILLVSTTSGSARTWSSG